MIAGLEIADLRVTARRTDVFSGTANRDSGDRLVVGLDDDRFLPNVPQYSGKRARVRLAPLHRASGTALLWIAPPRISAARIPDTGNDDLAKAGNAGQQENGQ
jgi:hypothetical protein